MKQRTEYSGLNYPLHGAPDFNEIVEPSATLNLKLEGYLKRPLYQTEVYDNREGWTLFQILRKVAAIYRHEHKKGNTKLGIHMEDLAIDTLTRTVDGWAAFVAPRRP
jgi:hypothetical protein